MVTHDVHVLIGRDNPRIRIAVKQYDTGVNLRIFPQIVHVVSKVRDRVEPYRIPRGATAYLDIAKADKKRVTIDGTIDGPFVIFECGKQAFTTVGRASAEMTMYAADGECITTATFYIDVKAEAASGYEEESEDYVDIFAKQIAQVNDAATQAAQSAAEAEDAAKRAEYAAALGGGNGGGNGGAVDLRVDETLSVKNGVLSVNTADVVEPDNSLPVTSAAVHTTVGNINALLEMI